MDIVAIKIPKNQIPRNDRYDALIYANKIMTNNNQLKHFRQVIDCWNYYIVDYGYIKYVKYNKYTSKSNICLYYTK
jgi:hypothetical protein